MTTTKRKKCSTRNGGAAMLSPAEVGELVGLTPAGVRRGELRERLPWQKIGARSLRCPREAVEALVRGEAA